MSGRIPGNSQNPYHYSAYPERPSSRQSNAQSSSMQRPPSRSGAFSTSAMYSALPRLQTNFSTSNNAVVSSPYSARGQMHAGVSMTSSRPPSRNGAVTPYASSSPLSAGSSVNNLCMRSPTHTGSSGRSISQQHSYSRSGSLYNLSHRPPSRSGNPSIYNESTGNELTDLRQLSPDERERFLNKHDPFRSALGLNANTSLYRITERQYVNSGRIQGNPNSMARVARHDRLVPDQIARNVFNARVGTAEAYYPAQGNASELGPSLNVMTGSRAPRLVKMYGSSGSNNVVVKMKLGDFLQRGGRVYYDSGAAVGDRIETAALIVTLPSGESVPAHVLE